MILADVVLYMDVSVHVQIYSTYLSDSVIQSCFFDLPPGKMAAVHPERPPSDMTSSALCWEEQRPPQKLPLTLWHCWASSLPVH